MNISKDDLELREFVSFISGHHNPLIENERIGDLSWLLRIPWAFHVLVPTEN